MKWTITIPRNPRYRDISGETYEDLMTVVKKRNPQALELAEDKEICDLHDLLILMRLGHFKVHHCECCWDEGRVVVEVCD